MLKLMGKYKNKEWQELDEIPADETDLKETKQFYEDSYREDLGQGWMFKWFEVST